ncbi:glycosyltransferase [Lactobacillus agrestimuris]|uniref:glycosyltransferase n=1 Tax=Lactobacillus agrestimuris TaxID=2941328 RepID=UPI0020442D2F|nr:glycosyltransferase [Lactobacillus agrestimuris]
MYKVLVYGFTDETVHGGLESAIMNYYRRFDKDKIRLDFICNSSNLIEYHDEIDKLGGNVFYTSKRGKNPFRYYREMDKLFKEIASNYDSFWFNANDLSNIYSVKLAKKYNIKRIIVHSHNSQIFIPGIKGKIYKKLHYANRAKIGNYATDLWACSNVAGKWMFPDNLDYKIIRNAIDINKTKFDDKKRNRIRHELGLQDAFVIGHVGRLNFQKNQKFIISLTPEIKKFIPNAKIVLVGDGEDKEEITNIIKSRRLQNDILLVGQKKDMAGWYSSFDMLLFPSLFEGLSVALLEAQANGLPILASDRVSPEEITINNNISFQSLETSKKLWIEDIKRIHKYHSRISNDEIHSNFEKKRYDIDVEAKRVEKELISE